jgi:transcriptional antiterminator NusG
MEDNVTPDDPSSPGDDRDDAGVVPPPQSPSELGDPPSLGSSSGSMAAASDEPPDEPMDEHVPDPPVVAPQPILRGEDEDEPSEAETSPEVIVPRPSQPSIEPPARPSAPVIAHPPPTGEKKWYIVHTYSGHENKAKLTLLERVKTHNLTEWFGDVLVPTESVTENVKGQRRTTTRKFFPGYMFVQMIMDDRTFHLVKNTPKITGFLGGMKPTPVPEREIHGVQHNVAEGKAGRPKARVSFEPGEAVRVVDGPFANFSATVEEVKADKQKVKVSLSMFGRATSVELDFAQVEKA